MEREPVLAVEGLRVRVGEREVLKGVDLTVPPGETHVLLGPNGSGKSTLLNTIMGFPAYEILEGSIRFRGRELNGLPLDERARLGIGIAFQRPPAVRGVKLRQLVTIAAERSPARSQAEVEPAGGSGEAGGNGAGGLVGELAEELNLDYLLDRDVNMGFSGGEAKRSEMAQLMAQSPELALFDEPESGVDLDNIAVVGGAMNRLLKGERIAQEHGSGLIVTHTGHILNYVNADLGHVLYAGQIACHGNPLDLFEEVERHGYDQCVNCEACRHLEEEVRHDDA